MILADRFEEREKLRQLRDKAIRDGKLVGVKSDKKPSVNAKSSALWDLKQKRMAPVKKRENKESSEPTSQEPAMDLATLSALVLTRKIIAENLGKPYFESI